MSRFTTLLTACALLPSVAVAQNIPKADYELKLDDYNIPIRDYQFPSGLRIMFQEEHSQPVVAVTSVIDHGSASDYPGMEGMAHVIEHLMFRAQHGDVPKNMDLIKQLGGSFNASTWDDLTDYMTVAPRDAAIPLMRLEALRMVNGLENVTEEHLDLEREICRNELRMRYENAIGDAWAALHKLWFPEGHPYRSLGIGTHQTLDNITLEAANRWVKEYYAPEYTTIVVVGDFSLDDTGQMIQDVFGDLPQLLRDPENPDAEIALVEAKSRVPEREEPPEPVGKGPITVMGEVEKRTVVVGWTLPAGYHGDEIDMQVATSLVQSNIINTLFRDYDPTKDSISWAGCSFQAAQHASMVTCYAEPRTGKTPEQTIGLMADALYSVWDPDQNKYEILRRLNDTGFQNAMASFSGQTLRTVDMVSSLWGRATSLAHYTHFTARPTYFSDQFEMYRNANLNNSRELARKYITRDRMVSVIVDPLTDEEKARRKAATTSSETDNTYHGSQAEDAFEFAFDLDMITPESIAKVTVTPDRDSITEYTLSNGLTVAVMPYGDAPIVRAGLFTHGNNWTSAQQGVACFAESHVERGSKAHWSENLGVVAGALYDTPCGSGGMRLGSTIWGEGASGNLDAVLRNIRQQTEQWNYSMADKSENIKIWRNGMKTDSKDVKIWADRLSRATVFKDHPWGHWSGASHYETMKEWDQSVVEGWLNRKYQPKNGTLIVVGKVDLEESKASIEKFFGGWRAPDKSADPPPKGLPGLGTAPDRRIMLLDKPGATQSEIITTCQLAPVKQEDVAAVGVIGSVASENVWRALREKAGVTYGAYAYTRWYPGLDGAGGPGSMGGWTLVQNDAIGFAVDTFLGTFDRLSKGTVSDRMLAAAKWTAARSYGLNQQSGDQMLSQLLLQHANGWGFDFFDQYPKDIGAVSKDDFTRLLSECPGHEVVTIVGPREFAEKQLEGHGYKYEVVDWEKLYEEMLTPSQLKKYLKDKAKKEAEKG